MKKIFVISCLIALNSSCEKDQLKDEKAVFIGKWEWVHTYHIYNMCEGTAIEEDLTPESESLSFALEFQERGFFIFKKNNEVIKTFKIKFNEFELTNVPSLGWYYFEISFNDDKELRVFRGSLDANNLVTTGFEGFEMTDKEPAGCEGYSSTFIKK